MAQATTHAPARAPVAPAAPAAVIVGGRPGAPNIPIPLTAADVDALRDRVSELAGQRSSVNNQRANLARARRSAMAGPDAAGLDTHIAQLDARLSGIESDISDLGKAISAAPSGLTQTTSTGVPNRFGRPNAGEITAVSIVGIICVLMPLSIAFARVLLRRANRPAAPQIPKDVSERLERMEQGIEAVALEVERIGEGQRFVTQLMSDRAQRAALPEGVPRT
ncbi:MAG: hypothetical protein ACREN6_06400 [Gemmatimonadaceae bacterium]